MTYNFSSHQRNYGKNSMHIQKNIVSMVTSARGKIVVQVSSVILYEHHSYVYFMLCSYVKNFMSPNVHKGAQVHKGGNL